MAVKVLADKKWKFTILTTKPANEAAPTSSELNGGIEACLKIQADGFVHRPVASDVVESKMLCGSKEQVMTDSNFEQSLRVVRMFLDGGGIDPSEDALFTALKTRGATLWAYGRLTDKDALDPWEDGDEIYLGTKFTPDWAAPSTEGGWIAADVPCTVQDGWPYIAVDDGGSS